MTLHEYPEIEQGTEPWHDLRRGTLTASVVGQLITPQLRVADNETSRALTTTLVAERLTGHSEDNYVNADMMRGTLAEPIARDLYSQHYAPATECGFLLREEDDWSLGFSPDGLVGTEGLLEIKAPRAKGHLQTILAGKVPARYMAQVQSGLLVTGREWLDFCSYHSGLPLYVTRVYPDTDWFDAIIAACCQFERSAAELLAAYTEATEGLPATERVVELEMSL
jgi:putative phage-type endonuclease